MNPDLTPREQAIRDLAAGKSPLVVAQTIGAPERVVRDMAAKFDWPRDVKALKRAASTIRGGGREHAGWIDGWTEPVPEGQPQPAAEATDEPTPVDVAVEWAALGQTVDQVVEAIYTPEVVEQELQEFLAQVDPLPILQGDPVLGGSIPVQLSTLPASSRATLTVPLLRLVGIDGRDVTVTEARIDVQVNPSGLLRVLAGDDAPWTAITAFVSSQLTAEGEGTVAELAALLALLPGGGGPA